MTRALAVLAVAGLVVALPACVSLKRTPGGALLRPATSSRAAGRRDGHRPPAWWGSSPSPCPATSSARSSSPGSLRGLRVDEYLRWAEPLDAGLSRTLAANLWPAPGIRVIRSPWPARAASRCGCGWSSSGSAPRRAARCVLEGRYALLPADGERPLVARSVSLSRGPLGAGSLGHRRHGRRRGHERARGRPRSRHRGRDPGSAGRHRANPTTGLRPRPDGRARLPAPPGASFTASGVRRKEGQRAKVVSRGEATPLTDAAERLDVTRGRGEASLEVEFRASRRSAHTTPASPPSEVAPHRRPVDLRQPQELLHVREVLDEPRGVVAHGMNLHGHEVLGPRHQHVAASELQPPGAGGKDLATRLLVDVDDVHAAPVRICVLVIRVPRRDVERLVPVRLQEADQRGLGRRHRDQVQVEGGPAVAVGVQRQGAHHGVGEGALFEEAREAVVDAGEVQAAPPVASLARPMRAPRDTRRAGFTPAFPGALQEVRSLGIRSAGTGGCPGLRETSSPG